MKELNKYIIKLCSGDKEAAKIFNEKMDSYFYDLLNSEDFNIFINELDELGDTNIKDFAFKYYLISIDTYYKYQLNKGENLSPKHSFVKYFPGIIKYELINHFTNETRKKILLKDFEDYAKNKIIEESIKKSFNL